MARTETYQKWSATEVDFLHENYDSMTAEAIADALNRTVESIWDKCEREKIRKHAKRNARSDEGPWLCPKCGKTKPIEKFGKGSGNRKGAPYCLKCTAQLSRDRRKKR